MLTLDEDYPDGTKLLWKVVFKDVDGQEFSRTKLDGSFLEACLEADEIAKENNWKIQMISRRY